ncbi:MAG: hypothetical protein R2717_03060 [Schumannella sp.]
MAGLAPVVVSLALWAVTGSVLSLLFAALGPVTALAGVVDAWRTRRRALRAERERVADDERELLRAAEGAIQAERTRLEGLCRHPSDPGWDEGEGALAVRVGTGPMALRLELEGDTGAPGFAAVRELVRCPAPGPHVVVAAGGLGIVGPPVTAAAIARSVVLQLASRLSPARVRLTAPPGEDWTDALPHEVRGGEGGAYRFTGIGDHSADDIVVAWAGRRTSCRWVAERSSMRGPRPPRGRGP